MPRAQVQLEAPPLLTGSFGLRLGQPDVPNCSSSKIWMEVGISREDAEGSHDPEDAERTDEAACDVGLFACELALHETSVSDESSGCEANDSEAKATFARGVGVILSTSMWRVRRRRTCKHWALK